MAVRLSVRPLKKCQGIDPTTRRRSWLDGYELTRWTVSDTAGEGRSETLDFDVRMADGRSLIEHIDLYATAKEFMFWIRASTYTRIDDARHHKWYGEYMLRLCYGLTARGIFSFAALRSIDIDMICEEAAYGVDGLTRASQLLKTALGQYDNWSDVPTNLIVNGTLDVAKVSDAFHLPMAWAAMERKSEVDVTSARLNGKLLLSAAEVKEGPVSVNNILRVTTIFDALFTLQHLMDASCIAFRPFPEGPSKRASDLGKATVRTPIPPPELALRLMENSTRFLVDHSDHIVTQYREMLAILNSGQHDRKRSEEVRRQVFSLSVACYILIATFTARRTEEIKLLDRRCIDGSDRTGWWMNVYIEKSERSRTWIPIPYLVVKAVEALRSLSWNNEQQPQGPLFEYVDPVLNRPVMLSPESSLNDFADSIGAREYANDNTKKTERWDWLTRQFRRFFAVLFHYRYRGKIQTLAHHLRHFDSQMTNDYVTLDPENAKIWAQEVWNFQVDIARDIVSGRSKYAGPMGKRLNMLVSRLQEKFSDAVIVVSELAGKALVRQLRKGQHVLTPKRWVTCTCPNNRVSCQKAACRKAAGYNLSDIGPNFAKAGPSVCPECPFALIGPENLEYIDEQIRRRKDDGQFVDGLPTIFSELHAADLIAISGFREKLEAA